MKRKARTSMAKTETTDMSKKGVKCRGRGKSRKDKLLEPLRTAASRVADLLLEISDCSELFVTESDGRYKKLDAKALKEFSSVIKEVGSVICELNGINAEDEKETCGIQIEFDDEAEECSK